MTRRARVLAVMVVAALTLLLVLWWNGAQPLMAWNLPDRQGSPMLIVAHDGDTDRAPENTAEAILAAAAAGADGIEFDVHQSADGTWWVIHDERVDRTTDGTGAVSQLSDVTLAKLHIDGGIGFRPEMAGTMGLPTLGSVLRELVDYRGVLYVDLQHAPVGSAAQLAETLAGHRATIICRTLADAKAVKEAAPAIGTMIGWESYDDSAFIDSLLIEAWNQVTPDRVAALPVPLVTWVDQRYYSRSEENVLRRAWALGIQAFLSRHFTSAVALRDQLTAESASSHVTSVVGSIQMPRPT